MKAFFLMLTFTTRLPGPKNLTFDPKAFAKGVYSLPFIGLLLGLFLMGANCLFQWMGLDYVGFWLLLIYIGLTGGLHLDGLADYVDGTFSYRSRSRMLEIMKDSHIGTFGVLALILYCLGMAHYMGQVSYGHLLLIPVVGRLSGLVLAGSSTYPKEEGMAKTLVDEAKALPTMILYLLALGGGWLIGMATFWGLVAVGIWTYLVYFRSEKVIGGANGDTLGFSIETAQLLYLVVVSSV